jgi:hypothetical protein
MGVAALKVEESPPAGKARFPEIVAIAHSRRACILPILYRRKNPAVASPPREVAIRALGVGLITIAAVLASLSVARSWNVERHPEPNPAPGRSPAPPAVNLDDIRAAGL